MGLIERLLCMVFPYVDIHRKGTTDIYLRRWFINPRNKDFSQNKGKPRLYLHKFYRGDEDPHMHDHPWPFTSLILTRGYWEERPYVFCDPFDISPAQEQTMRYIPTPDKADIHARHVFYKRFSIVRRPAVWKHRVILKDKKPVWTIVRTGVKERGWGFWMGDKLCPWRQYDDGNCLEEPKAANPVFE